MPTIGAFQWVTAVVAFWGAVLGTISIAWQRKRDRRLLRLEAKIVPIIGQKTLGVMIRIENVGHRTVYIDEIDFLVARRRGKVELNKQDWRSTPPLPCELKEGQGLTALGGVHGFAEDLFGAGYRGRVRLRPRCIDGVTTEYFGKPLKFDIGRWRLET